MGGWEKLESKSFSTNRSTGGNVGREVVTEVAMSETRRLGASLPNSTSACALKRAPGNTIAPNLGDTHAPQNRPWRTIGFRNAHARIVRVSRVLTLYYECYVLSMTPTRYVTQFPRYTC